MKYNRLGNTGLFVSQLGFGSMDMGEQGRGLTDQGDANALVARAFESGINLFDCANNYGSGSAEPMLGAALRNLGVAREKFVLTSKGWFPRGTGPNDSGASRGYLLDAAKSSLRQLGVDHIDLYQVHGFDAATPMEETLRALDDLVRQGHVRYVGVSNWAAWQIAKALGISERLGIARFASMQGYYSVVSRDIEREVVPLLQSEGLGLLVWSPLAGGFLVGAHDRETEPAFAQFFPFDRDRGYATLQVLRGIADAHGASVAQVSLSWLMHQKAVSAVLTGPTRMDLLEDSLKAIDLALTADDLAAIDKVSAMPPEYPGWMIDFQSKLLRDWSENRRVWQD